MNFLSSENLQRIALCLRCDRGIMTVKGSDDTSDLATCSKFIIGDTVTTTDLRFVSKSVAYRDFPLFIILSLLFCPFGCNSI